MGSSDVGDLEGLIFAPVPPVSQIAAAIPSCRLRRRPPQGRCGGARRARHQRRPAAVSFAPSARARLGRQWARRHPSRIQLRRCPSCHGAPWLKRIERSNSAKKRSGYRGLAQTCTAWKLKLKASALRAAVPWPKETKDKKGARRRLVASGGPRAEAIPARADDGRPKPRPRIHDVEAMPPSSCVCRHRLLCFGQKWQFVNGILASFWGLATEKQKKQWAPDFYRMLSEANISDAVSRGDDSAARSRDWTPFQAPVDEVMWVLGRAATDIDFACHVAPERLLD
eukprot:s1396_g11.t1